MGLRLSHPPGSVKDFERHEVPFFVIVKDHARLVLIALSDRYVSRRITVNESVLTS